MNFPVWIGVNENGTPIIGAKAMKGQAIVQREQVYGSQIPHRCVWRSGGEWWLGTPSEMRAERLQGKTVEHVCRITGWQSV